MHQEYPWNDEWKVQARGALYSDDTEIVAVQFAATKPRIKMRPTEPVSPYGVGGRVPELEDA